MSRSMTDSVYTSLIKQLVFFDENSTLLLDKYSPKFDRDRKEVEQLMNRYKEHLENIVRDFDDKLLNSVVLIGSQVTIDYVDDGIIETYTIVLPEHSDMEQYCISFLSPIGRSLLLAKVGDTVTVPTPTDSYDLHISNIKFLVY
jgi:transcription elongation factor GreA